VVKHDGIGCSECQMMPIQGIRFKCSVRENYNLCEACEAKDSTGHPMLKIRQPTQVKPVVE